MNAHKYRLSRVLHPLGLIFLISFGMLSCEEDDSITSNEEPQEEVDTDLKTGFVINVQTPGNPSTYIAKYYSQLPSGTADLTDGQSFQNFLVRDVYNGAMYSKRTDNTNAVAKTAVDSTGRLYEAGVIATRGDNPFLFKIANDSTGVFHDRFSATEISIFDPRTMELTGVIDMSAGVVSEPQRYQDFVIRNNEVFATLRPEVGGGYDKLTLQSANLETGQYIGQTEFATGITIPDAPFGQRTTDENGNIYVVSLGYAQAGQPIASLHKVPAGSTEFDPEYNWQIALTANPVNTFLPTFDGFYYYKNNIAIAIVAVDVPQELVDLVTSVGGDPRNLSNEQIQQAIGILFAAENARWVKLNLVEQTLEIIEGIPASSPFGFNFVTEINGELYIQLTNKENNAFYKYNVESGVATKAFDVVGGNAQGLYDLSRNN